MTLDLQLQNSEQLTAIEKTDIESIIDKTIIIHQSNRSEISKLIMESVTCLTVSEARASELANQGFFKRLQNGFSGKTQKIRAELDRNIAKTQYASQQMIQKLAEQNLLSFELTTAVNNKLNTMITEVDEEMNKIYSALIVFFKQTRSDINQLEIRLQRIEQNVNLLHWKNTIEYQMIDGVEYSQLQDAEKVVCLVNDFYVLTDGKWSTADLLLLKATMTTIGIDIKKDIIYREFMENLIRKPKLIKKLFGNTNIEMAINIEPFQASFIKGLEKHHLLQTCEKYIVDTVATVSSFNCQEEIELILVDNYLKTKAVFDISKSVNIFDFVLELLVNISALHDTELNKSEVFEQHSQSNINCSKDCTIVEYGEFD